MPDPHSHPMTGEPLEVPIAPDPGGPAAAVISAVMSDPDWNDPQGLVMDAPFQPSVNPLCLAVDGDRYPPGTTKESLNLNHIQYGNCDCFLLPCKWKYGVDRDPSGRIHEPKRPATGDSGYEESISYRVTAEAWLRDNPKTAVAILGEDIAAAFLGRCSDGRPLPPIPLKWAAERWAAAVQAEEDRQRAVADEIGHASQKATGATAPREGAETTSHRS